MTAIQIIIIVTVIVVVLVTMILLMSGQDDKRKKRAVSIIQGSRVQAQDKKISEADQQDKRRAEISKKLQDNKGSEDGTRGNAIQNLIGQAGLSMPTQQFFIFSGIAAVVCMVLAKLMGQSLLVMGLAAAIGFFGVPRIILKRMAKGRQKKFLEEFPDSLEAMVRLLKAGMPVSEAISMIAREYTGPVGEEMSRVYDQQKIGVPIHEAAFEATRRIPLPEMQMFATGLAIQAQTGSSLSDVLMNLSGVIRARFRLKRKVKALSSEAIASASIIGALPNLVALGLYFANREYIMLLFTDPFGKILLAGAVTWMFIGIMAMKVMINFKI